MRRVPWVGFAALLLMLGLRLATFLEPLAGLLPGCLFKRLIGLPCVTCGLTRCALAVGRMDWRAAFHWHPLAALGLVMLPLAVAWDLRRAWRGEPYPALPDSQKARILVWVLLFAGWALQVARGV